MLPLLNMNVNVNVNKKVTVNNLIWLNDGLIIFSLCTNHKKVQSHLNFDTFHNIIRFSLIICALSCIFANRMANIHWWSEIQFQLKILISFAWQKKLILIGLKLTALVMLASGILLISNITASCLIYRFKLINNTF